MGRGTCLTWPSLSVCTSQKALFGLLDTCTQGSPQLSALPMLCARSAGNHFPTDLTPVSAFKWDSECVSATWADKW